MKLLSICQKNSCMSKGMESVFVHGISPLNVCFFFSLFLWYFFCLFLFLFVWFFCNWNFLILIGFLNTNFQLHCFGITLNEIVVLFYWVHLNSQKCVNISIFWAFDFFSPNNFLKVKLFFKLFYFFPSCSLFPWKISFQNKLIFITI